MPNPKLDAEGFPISSAPAVKLDSEGFPVASAAAPKVDHEGFPVASPPAMPADFAAYKAAQQAPPVGNETEFAPIASGQSSLSVAPSLPVVKDVFNWAKTIPGKLKDFAVKTQAEHDAAVKAQQEKLGTAGRLAYQAPNPLLSGLPTDLAAEAGKTIAGKVQKAWQALKPNRAKENAEWAEQDMKDLLKEVGDKVPTPEQYQRFKDRRAYADQMWALSETDRGKRNEAVQGFQERMDKALVPGTPAAKFLGSALPLAAQAAFAPETIAPEMALNQLVTGQLGNPAYEQTTKQQLKEALAGYGFGKFMTAGVPGVPVSRALQGLGVPALPANLAGIVPTSVTNVLGGHQLQRSLTTPHGDIPASPGLQDYLTDMAMQVGLQGPHLGYSFQPAAGAPPIGSLAELGAMPGRPLETPMTPGSLNAPPVESRPLSAPLAQSREPVRKPAETLAQLGGLNAPGPEGLPEIQPRTYQGPLEAGKGPSAGVVTPGIRVQPDASAGLPDAYGLAPVTMEPTAPTPYKTLHEHEAEMAMTKQQRQADREALANGPIEATSDIAPEHHAEADSILEARDIVTRAERKALEAEREILAIQFENRQREVKGKGKEPKPIPEALTNAAKNRLAPDDPVRQLAASEPSHPDVQWAMDVANEQQQALAPEYAAGTPGAEGDITHAKREMLKKAPVEPTLSEKAKSFFFGIKPPVDETPSPGTGKRPVQKDKSSIARSYETVDGPTGPTVIYKSEPGATEHDIVGRSGKIQEADITGRRESTKDEITHATSQVEVEIPGEIDPETGEPGPSHTEIELHPEQAIHFSRNAVASAANARETARAAIRGRAVIDNLKANPALFKPGEATPGDGNRNVSDLPITKDIKGRLGDGNVPSDVANTLVEYFGEPGAREANFWNGLNKASRQWIERGFMTNPFIHFQNQFAHGLGALASEGLTSQEATAALSHAYREGANPNSEYVNRAKAAGVKQMSEGRVLGQNDNLTAHEVATAKLEAALGHEPGALGKTESGPIRNGFRALNQKAVWQVDDAIRNTLFYQKVASGMSPKEAANYANHNYVGYHTDTNLFELNHGQPSKPIQVGKAGDLGPQFSFDLPFSNKQGDPNHWAERLKKLGNYAYAGLVTGKGQSNKGGFQEAGGTLARTLVAPLFSTFRTNSAQLLGHELKGAGSDLANKGSLAGLGKLANVAGVGTAVGGAVGQTLSDALLSDKEKAQGKEYQMRMGGPFHWYDTAEKMLEGRANGLQTMAAIATPNPIFKQLGKSIAGVDVTSGRRAPATSLSELGDTALGSVLPTGDIGRNALQGQGNYHDMIASFFTGKNAPNEAAQIAMAHPNSQAAGTPDYENSKANFKLISTLRNLEPGSKEYSDAIQQAISEHVLTTRQIQNAAKRSGQTELEHMRALGKITSDEGLMAMADTYAEKNPTIARVLYGDLQQRTGKENQKLRGVDSLKALGQQAANKQLALRNQ